MTSLHFRPTFTGAARLAAPKQDPEMAFDLVKQMKSCGIIPKLRFYGPVLLGFYEKMMMEKDPTNREKKIHLPSFGKVSHKQGRHYCISVRGETKVLVTVYRPKAGTKKNGNPERACTEVIWTPKAGQKACPSTFS